MVGDEFYESLGRKTEEMYLGLAKVQSAEMQDQLVAYHQLVDKEIGGLIANISTNQAGEILQQQRRKLQILKEDFSNLKSDIGSKYKIYLRGCGKAGKSTLLNALLSIDENTGSKMGRIPMTFTIDTYTDEMEQDEAEIRRISEKGKGTTLRTSRSKAIEIVAVEEAAFKKSKEQCEKMIHSKVQDIYLEKEREDIETDIYKQYLMKTCIRETRWGIGKNLFFHNCVLIDTPGLSQELRFTNVIEEVKNYEVDGIIWVINSDTLAKAEIIQAYKNEFKEMESVYADKKVIAVINMYGTGEEYKRGSKLWKRVEDRAQKICCERYGFNKIICVNARLAYDGNVSQDRQKIEDSNISELRKMINEMFVEKSSEEYHQAKLKKIDSFMDKFYQDVNFQVSELQLKLTRYQDIKTRIMSEESACDRLVTEEKYKIQSEHLAIVKSRINTNLSQINRLNGESDSVRKKFLKDTIIDVEELSRKMCVALDRCEESIFYRFKELQTQSIISDFHTKEYALKNFQKREESISMKKGRRPIVITSSNGWDVKLFDVVENTFGINSIVTRVTKEVLNVLKPPAKRAYEEIADSIDYWVSKIELSEPITGYANKCYDTLDQSMKYTCGAHDDVQKIHKYMKAFINDRSPMTWKNIGLLDILGGTKDV